MENQDKYQKGVGGDQEKHTGEQGEFFTFDGTDNLGVTDMFVDDGFDIIHQHAGEVHLSDLSPEEEETAIPKGSKKIKKTELKPRLDKGPFNISLLALTEDDGYIDDMVYIDEPRDKHIRRMGKELGGLMSFPLNNYKNIPPPENESNTTEDEIGYLEGIPVDKNLVDSADALRQHFTKFLKSKELEYPKEELKEVMQAVTAIILKLKYHYNRPRPFQIAKAKGLELNAETLQSSSSPSYPSGHATQGRFIARYLSDLYPEYRNELMQIGDDIAFSRNMAKVHYPSDSAFGKVLGDDMYDFITNNTINEHKQPGPMATGVDRLTISEHSESLRQSKNLNPELMVGDEITIIDNSTSVNAPLRRGPERFKDYVVTSIRYRQPDNWEGPDVDRKYYQIQPIDGYSDEEATSRMLSGGGRIREVHLYPLYDKWMLRKGFRRGELEEEGETNEAARTLSKARKAGVDTYYPKSAVKANPQRFRKYTRDKYLNEYNQPGLNPELKVDDIIRVIDVDGEHGRMPERFGIYKVVKVGNAYPLMTKRNRGHDTFYDVMPYPEVESRVTRYYEHLPTHHEESDFTLYRGDTWIYWDKEMVNEQEDNQDDGPQGVEYGTFNRKDIIILNYISKQYTQQELKSIWEDTSQWGAQVKKWDDIMKLFSIPTDHPENLTISSKYARWAWENWDDAKEYEMDFGKIPNPIKTTLKWYDVDMEETGSQIEYKSGNTDILGFDEDNVETRAEDDFYGWGGELETHDWGDYESYDQDVIRTDFLRMEESVRDNQKLLFNFWKKVGPTLDPDKLKLVGFNMDVYKDSSVVWDNLKEYYGDEELTNIIQERLEGLHDSWNYEYIVTDFNFDGDEIYLNVLVNGDAQIPMAQEEGGVIDMSLWDINEKAAEEGNDGGNYYDDIYDEVRDSVSDDIKEFLLKDLPVDADLEYLDISEPGSFEDYVKFNKVEMVTIKEDDDGYIDEDLENWSYDGEDIGVVDEQMIPDKIDMIKHDIFKSLSSRFEVIKDDGGEISDNEGNRYSIIDSEEEIENVGLSDLLTPITDFLSIGLKDGTFESNDIDAVISSVTDWLALELNKKQPLLN